MLEIEFFHDVICSFCFPMSARMRRLVADNPEIQIKHRSFALGWDETVFEQMFGSHEAVKNEVLGHWEHANQNDDEHRFNIEGMKETDFLFPTSKPGLIAARAAGLIGDEETYWDVFDKIQEGLFIRNLNIQNTEVIEELVKETTINVDQWREAFHDATTEQMVINDLKLAQAYQIQGAPALVINQKYLLSGAQPYEVLEKAIQEIMEQEEN
ncbi:DsbA family protein [Aerococcaceae bacterium DSM 111020]|nr:DsbA family protein [Aerococcaceae bacterium DSM 111020]